VEIIEWNILDRSRFSVDGLLQHPAAAEKIGSACYDPALAATDAPRRIPRGFAPIQSMNEATVV
jgi:hypothetical protein